MKKDASENGSVFFFESGAKGRIRTADLRLMSPALYRLSYPGKNEI